MVTQTTSGQVMRNILTLRRSTLAEAWQPDARFLFTSWELGGEAGSVASSLSDLSEVIKQNLRLSAVT